jgi:Transglycosylase SLT domain
VFRLRRLALVAAALVGCAIVAVLLKPSADEDGPVIRLPGGQGKEVEDPFAWTPERGAALSQRAAAGVSGLLFERSPGGAAATAQRVKRFRAPIERAAKAARVNPDLLEGLVFLESAGRPDARAPGGIEGAAGLTQILAETGTNLLGMKIDLARSASYTRRQEKAIAEGKLARAAALSRARKRVDARFDPAQALQATARYLKLAIDRFGREDLAFVSYHMGMGNLENVLKAFGGGRRSYAELYFDSTPLRHPKAQRLLASFGDDSSNYYWKLLAAREIMHGLTSPRSGRDALLRNAPQGGLRTLKGTPDTTGLSAAADVQLRPEALATALYMAAQVRAISKAPTLRITHADDGGWTFRVSRRYTSPQQALAFQYVLDRLQVLNVIAWSRTRGTIRVTASQDAKALEPLLER